MELDVFVFGKETCIKEDFLLLTIVDWIYSLQITEHLTKLHIDQTFIFTTSTATLVELIIFWNLINTLCHSHHHQN